MTLKNVVFPAPFGPMRAVIDPSRMSIVAPLTARMPPKRLTTPSALKMGASLTEHHLLALAEYPLWPEGHEQDQDQADHHESQGRDLVRRQGQIHEPHSLEHHPEDDRPDEDAAEAGETADDQRREAEEGEQGLERVLRDRLEVEGEEPAGDRAQDGGDRERLQLVGERVLAERPRRVLVLADRTQHAPPGGADEEVKAESDHAER